VPDIHIGAVERTSHVFSNGFKLFIRRTQADSLCCGWLLLMPAEGLEPLAC